MHAQAVVAWGTSTSNDIENSHGADITFLTRRLMVSLRPRGWDEPHPQHRLAGRFTVPEQSYGVDAWSVDLVVEDELGLGSSGTVSASHLVEVRGEGDQAVDPVVVEVRTLGAAADGAVGSFAHVPGDSCGIYVRVGVDHEQGINPHR